MKNINFRLSFFIISLMVLIKSDTKHYLYITSHGMAATDRVYRLWAPYYYIGNKKIVNECSTIFYPLVSFNYEDSFRHSLIDNRFANSIFKKIIGKIRFFYARLIRGWYFNSSLGQENDCNRLVAVIKKYCKDDQKCILQGVSRGASVIIPTLALNPDLPVKAIILESPFDSIDSVLDHIVNKLGNWNILKKYKYLIFKSIFQYHIKGLYAPIDFVNLVNKDIPILIICSISDHLVPVESSIRLYNALVKAGHTKVHIVILSKGKHGFLLQGEDKKIYESAVHSFYKKYGLPYAISKINSDQNIS